MRRIIVIAAGPAGVACATRIKRRLPEEEINVIIPAAVVAEGKDHHGPAGRRFAALLPDVEALAQREISVLETDDIMPDLEAREITVGSSRGRLPMRYNDLLLEVPATVRIPRPLQKAGNVFAWPMPGFAAKPAALDAALEEAASAGGLVVVTGNGAAALETVLLACEAGAPVRWLRTKDPETPDLEEQLLRLALRKLGAGVSLTDLPDHGAEDLVPVTDTTGERLLRLNLPDGTSLDLACAVWTGPLMARHPVLREDGVVLDARGRIVVSEPQSCPGLLLMGSGSALEDAELSFSGARVPAFPGGEETAELSGWAALDALTGRNTPGGAPRPLAVRRASGAGLHFYRAGLSLAECETRECEYACLSLPLPEELSKGEEESLLALSLVCDKNSRSLLGAQVLSMGLPAAPAEGLFGMALAALGSGSGVDALARQQAPGLPGELLSRGARILCNKLDGIIQGISPAEFLASRAAGAEFFTLDLRSHPDWKQGHAPGSYNIPLSQLKKRIQDEVPRFTPIVTISAYGCEAYVAACRMAGLGAQDLYVLDGGMALWPHELEVIS